MSNNTINHNAKLHLFNAGMSILKSLAGVIVLVLLASTANAGETTAPACDPPASCTGQQLWDTLEDAAGGPSAKLVLVLGVLKNGTVVGFASPASLTNHGANDNAENAEANGNIPQKLESIGIMVTIKNPQVCWYTSNGTLHCINY